jgi:hypothetical protein
VQRLTLEGEQSDLGAIPMGDDDLVVAGELRDRADSGRDVRALSLGVGGLTTAQERIATECNDNSQDLPTLSTHVDHGIRVVACAG